MLQDVMHMLHLHIQEPIFHHAQAAETALMDAAIAGLILDIVAKTAPPDAVIALEKH